MTRHNTITVTLEEPLDEEYVEELCTAIEMIDGVTDAEPGTVNNLELHAAKQQLRGDAFEAIDSVFE